VRPASFILDNMDIKALPRLLPSDVTHPGQVVDALELGWNKRRSGKTTGLHQSSKSSRPTITNLLITKRRKRRTITGQFSTARSVDSEVVMDFALYLVTKEVIYKVFPSSNESMCCIHLASKCQLRSTAHAWLALPASLMQKNQKLRWK